MCLSFWPDLGFEFGTTLLAAQPLSQQAANIDETKQQVQHYFPETIFITQTKAKILTVKVSLTPGWFMFAMRKNAWTGRAHHNPHLL